MNTVSGKLAAYSGFGRPCAAALSESMSDSWTWETRSAGCTPVTPRRRVGGQKGQASQRAPSLGATVASTPAGFPVQERWASTSREYIDGIGPLRSRSAPRGAWACSALGNNVALCASLAAVPSLSRVRGSSESRNRTPRMTRLAGPLEGSGAGVVSTAFCQLAPEEALPCCYLGQECIGAIVLVLDLVGIGTAEELEARAAMLRDVMGQLDLLPAGCPPRFVVFLNAKALSHSPQVETAVDNFLEDHHFSLQDPVARPFFLHTDGGDELYTACQMMCGNIAGSAPAAAALAAARASGVVSPAAHLGPEDGAFAHAASTCCNCWPWTKRGVRDPSREGFLDDVT